MLANAMKSLTRRLKRIQNPTPTRKPTYDSDGLTVHSKHPTFLNDPRFMSAYRRGIDSGQRFGDGVNKDIHIEWRVAVTCWAASHGKHLPGDFVECGVNTGIYSLAICEYLDFNRLDKSFYLFDTYAGIPADQLTAAERPHRVAHEAHYYDCYDIVRTNFSPYPRAVPVRGKVPDTLESVKIDRVAYLSIDMNVAYPERKAIEHFWPKLSSGACVVFDDYAWFGYEAQRDTLDEFARSVGVQILALPTGQGLLLKP